MANAENFSLTCNTFEAWVSVDNKALEQFAVQKNELSDEASCWITSEKDQPFSVTYRKKAVDKDDYKVQIFLDGICIWSKVLKRDANEPNIPRCISTLRISGNEVKNFVFDSIDAADDDTEVNHRSHDIGEIKVVVAKVKINRKTSYRRNTRSYDWRSVKADEYSRKGLAHQIKLGNVSASTRARTITRYRYTPYGSTETFRFRYRPLAFLQATGIAPRPSIPPARPENEHIDYIEIPDSPVASVEAEDEDEDEDEDEAEDSQSADMEAREKALLAELEQVRRERAILAELEQIRLAKRAASFKKDKGANKKIKTEVKTDVKTEL